MFLIFLKLNQKKTEKVFGSQFGTKKELQNKSVIRIQKKMD